MIIERMKNKNNISLRNKKMIVTGHLGFLGSHLVDHLINEGAEVYGIDNLFSGSEKNANPKTKQNIIKDFINQEDLFDIFLKIKPDYVFHVGAWSRMPLCLEDPIGAYKNNVLGSVNILEASKRVGVKKVVLSSSCAVYCGETPYKTSKLAMEDIARVYRSTYGLSTICLRYGNIYGTRQNADQDSAVFAMFKKSYNEKGSVDIFGDGKQTRDWINVADICEANILAVLSDYQGELDIATGRSISLNYIVKVLGVKANHVSERKGDVKYIKLNVKPANSAIGFRAKIKFEDGIKEIWEI